MRDSIQEFDIMEPKQRPSFHEIRSLGARIYIEMGFDKKYTQYLMTHSNLKTTQIYLEDGIVSDDRFIKVNADMKLASLPNV